MSLRGNEYLKARRRYNEEKNKALSEFNNFRLCEKLRFLLGHISHSKSMLKKYECKGDLVEIGKEKDRLEKYHKTREQIFEILRERSV